MDDEKRFVTTTIRVRADVWARLRQLVHVRSLENGGRASASALVAELVEREAARLAERARADA